MLLSRAAEWFLEEKVGWYFWVFFGYILYQLWMYVIVKGGTLETQESKRDTEAVPRVSFKNYHVHPLGPSTAL